LQRAGLAPRVDRRPGRHEGIDDLRAVAAQQRDPALALLQRGRGLRVERHVIAVAERLRGRERGELGTLDRNLASDVGRHAARQVDAFAFDLLLLLDQDVAVLQAEEKDGRKDEAEREQAERGPQRPGLLPETPRPRIGR